MTEPTVTRDPDLDPQILGMLQMMDAAQAPPMYEGTAAQARASSRMTSVDMRDPPRCPTWLPSRTSRSQALRATWAPGCTARPWRARDRPSCTSTGAAS